MGLAESFDVKGTQRMMDVYQQEVLDLHRFLDAWLKGDVPKDDGQPKRLADALAEDFVVIHPSGMRASKADAVRGFASAYGKKPPGYALLIDRVETRMIGEGLCLATYEERHRGELGRARVATAVLRRRSRGEGIEWLFLQETLAPHLESTQMASGNRK